MATNATSPERKNIEYTSVSDVESTHAKKYAVSGGTPSKSGVRIAKWLCALLVMGALLLAALSALAIYLLIAPLTTECTSAARRGNDAPPAALTKTASAHLPIHAPAPAAVREVPMKRSPKHLTPTHYTLKLMPFLIEENFTTHGNVTIDLECHQATDVVYLHAVDVDIIRTSMRFKFVGGDYFFRITNVSYDVGTQRFAFQLDRRTRAGESYLLHMSFVSRLGERQQGFYRSRYEDRESRTQRWIAATQFSPIDARRAFPCFDEPDFKATFDVSLARPNYMTTLSNMPLLSTEDSEEMAGYSWDNYQRTPPMATYLLAFVVSDLQPYEFGADGRTYRIWSRKDAIGQSIYASDVSPRLLRYFEKYLESKYPLSKLDQVAVPDFGFKAMENWGLIAYRESHLLLNDTQTSIEHQRALLATIAHEIAHQWFGNLVTPRFWNDLWLKEGFAEFFMYRGVHHIEPKWNYTEDFLLDEQLTAMDTDAHRYARPLRTPEMMGGPAAIRQTFDTIAYKKGAAIIHMLQNIYGEDNFRSAIKHYLDKYQYSNADYEEFVAALGERSLTVAGLKGVDLKSMLDTWVTQPGFPVVTVVTADDENSTLTLTQRRFVYPSDAVSGSGEKWWIPVSYATKTHSDFGDTRPKFWMRPDVAEAHLHIDFQDGYLLNLQHTGYYVVNYDARNWERVVRDLRNFPLVTRAQLLANAMDLARANLLDYDVPLKMLPVIGGWDAHYVSYAVAFTKLDYVHRMLHATPAFAPFDRYLRTVFDQAFAHTMLLEQPSDTHEARRLRILVLRWSCRTAESRCVGHARQLFRAMMVNNKPIQPNLREIVYCTSIREGGEVEWRFAHQLYQNSSDAADREMLLAALGCAEQPWLLRQYLDAMLDPVGGVRKQDGHFVFEAVARNPRGYRIAFEFLRANWNALKEYYGLGFNRLSKMVATLSMYMNSRYDLEQLEAFAADVDLVTARGAYEAVHEQVRANVAWMRMCYESVRKWLEMYGDHFGL